MYAMFFGGVFAFVLLCGCSTLPDDVEARYSTPFSSRNPLVDGKLAGGNSRENTTMLQEAAVRWIDAYNAVKCATYKKLRDSSSVVGDACNGYIDDMNAAIRLYVGTGLAYAQRTCDVYFSQLTYTKAHRDHAKSHVGLVGGLASGLLGLAKASAASIAATGSIAGFGIASFEAYDSAYLVSPEVETLQALVRKRQQLEEDEIYEKLNAGATKKWPEAIRSLDEADRALDGYIYHCQVNGIRSLFADSVKEKIEKLQKDRKPQGEKGKR